VVVDLSSQLQLLNGGMGDGGRAGVLQRLNHYLGDPGRLPAEMQKLAAVDAAQVQRQVQAFLGAKQRLSVITVPKQAESKVPHPSSDGVPGSAAAGSKTP
jgi:hypothetical protein